MVEEYSTIYDVLAWIVNSTDRFNDGLKVVSAGLDGHIGWSGGYNFPRIFTGHSFCDTATQAYGLSLPERFRGVNRLKNIVLNPRHMNGGFHRLLGFSVAGLEFFVDGTYGQIHGRPNRVKVAPMNRLEHIYKPTRLPARQIAEFLEYEASNNPIIRNRRVMIANFYSENMYDSELEYLKNVLLSE